VGELCGCSRIAPPQKQQPFKAPLQSLLYLNFAACGKIKLVMPNDPLYYSLIEASAKPGCPVCRVMLHLVDRYLNALFYESVNDTPTRSHLRNSRGFCSSHAWRLLDGDVGNALGISIIYHDVLTNILRELPALDTDQGRLGSLTSFLGRVARQTGDRLKIAVNALTPKQPCLACKEREEVSLLATTILLNSLGDERFAAALAESEGLCLPHLKQALELAEDEKLFPILLDLNRPKLEALNTELAEFIRKNDYRFHSEGFGSEGSSWRKVVSKIQGERES
jgi:hypothetical protein